MIHQSSSNVFLPRSMQVCGSHPASCIVHLPELLWSILHALHGDSAVKEETYWSIYAGELRPPAYHLPGLGRFLSLWSRPLKPSQSSFCKITHLCASSTTRYMSLWAWGQRHLETRYYGTLCHYGWIHTSMQQLHRHLGSGHSWWKRACEGQGSHLGNTAWEHDSHRFTRTPAKQGSQVLPHTSDIRPALPLSPPQPTLVCITFVCTL